MNISEFIELVTPGVAESARNRELSKSKFDNNKTVSGVAFLIKAAQQGDIGALLAMSTLLYKESNDCISTKQMAVEYAQEVLQQDPKNKLAKKVIVAIKNEPAHKKIAANSVGNNAIPQDYKQNKQNVITLTKSMPLLETKSEEIKLGNNPKVR